MIKIHHLNVGHGDTIVIELQDSDRLMVIDVNRSSEFDDDTKKELIKEAKSMVDLTYQRDYELGLIGSAGLFKEAKYNIQITDPIKYINDLGYSSIFRFIQTHPHMDHLTGISALFNEINVWNIWCHKNNFNVDESKLSESRIDDWKLYKKFRDSAETKLDGTTIVRPKSGEQRDFWHQDNITILSPTSDLVDLAHEKDNRNIMSYVLLLEYGGRKFVFGGDAEKETWEYIVDNYAEEISGVTVLDASHHGRDSGYYEPALELMKPTYVVVSVGKKPSTDASNKYKKHSENVWSTRWKGNITFTINLDGSGSYDPEYDR